MAANEQTNGPYSEDDLISLGKKLASLELTDPERAALGALISDDDVGGFGRAGRFGGIDLIAGIRVGFRAVPGPSSDPGARGVRADWNQASGIRKPGRF